MEKLFITLGLFFAAIFLFYTIAFWKIFSKAGKPGWASIVPIYNLIVFLEIVGKPWTWVILLLIPFVNIIPFIIVTHRLSRSFGKGLGFTLGLLIFSVIFYPILAFGSAKYVGPNGQALQSA